MATVYVRKIGNRYDFTKAKLSAESVEVQVPDDIAQRLVLTFYNLDVSIQGYASALACGDSGKARYRLSQIRRAIRELRGTT